MKLNIKIVNILFGITLILSACNSKPQVIEHEPTIPGNVPSVSNNTDIQHEIDDAHLVTVKEVLQAEKYTYLNVNENEDLFWIAISKMEVKVGDRFSYTGGLKKRNFESKEFNRVFETVYLVSRIRKLGLTTGNDNLKDVINAEANRKDLPVTGATRISDIVSNPSKYGGKKIIVAGECVKINPQIMGRNWVHIQDGSTNEYDFTITTQENIPVGAIVVLEGIISLDKDFGAGYRYDIIMEDAVIKK